MAASAARIAELEEALQAANDRTAAAEQRLAGLLDQTGPGMLLVNPTGTIKRINETLSQLLGLANPLNYWEDQPAETLLAQAQRLAVLPEHPALRLATLRAATDPDARGSEFFGPSGPGEAVGHPVRVLSTSRSHRGDLQRRLWDASTELTGVEFSL